jgi:hypothetical protein
MGMGAGDPLVSLAADSLVTRKAARHRLSVSASQRLSVSGFPLFPPLIAGEPGEVENIPDPPEHIRDHTGGEVPVKFSGFNGRGALAAED